MGDENLKALPPLDETPVVKLGNALNALLGKVETAKTQRMTLFNSAKAGWVGAPVDQLTKRFDQGGLDGQELVDALKSAANFVSGPTDSLLAFVRTENARREHARNWLAAKAQWIADHPDRKGFLGNIRDGIDNVGEFFDGSDWEDRLNMKMPGEPEPLIKKIVEAPKPRRVFPAPTEPPPLEA